MTTALLPSLIDKRDAFEIVGDQIALILANEIANQRALAAASGDPSGDWNVRVYREIDTPWEFFRDPTEAPVVSVNYSRGDLVPAETTVTTQVYEAEYILIFGAAGQAKETQTGQMPGDMDAAIRLQRAVRLVRNILSAGLNQYLQLRGTVGTRRVTMIEMFQAPNLATAENMLDHVAAARVTLACKIKEYSPEVEGEPLELIALDLKKGQDGAIIAQMEFDYEED